MRIGHEGAVGAVIGAMRGMAMMTGGGGSVSVARRGMAITASGTARGNGTMTATDMRAGGSGAVGGGRFRRMAVATSKGSEGTTFTRNVGEYIGLGGIRAVFDGVGIGNCHGTRVMRIVRTRGTVTGKSVGLMSVGNGAVSRGSTRGCFLLVSKRREASTASLCGR